MKYKYTCELGHSLVEEESLTVCPLDGSELGPYNKEKAEWMVKRQEEIRREHVQHEKEMKEMGRKKLLR